MNLSALRGFRALSSGPGEAGGLRYGCSGYSCTCFSDDRIIKDICCKHFTYQQFRDSCYICNCFCHLQRKDISKALFRNSSNNFVLSVIVHKCHKFELPMQKYIKYLIYASIYSINTIYAPPMKEKRARQNCSPPKKRSILTNQACKDMK